MNDTSTHSATRASPNFGLPSRNINIPDSHSSSVSSSALPSATTHPPSRKGIRVRVNSLGAAIMFKNISAASAAASSQAVSSSEPLEHAKLKTRLRSATSSNRNAHSHPSCSASCAHITPLQLDSSSTSASSLPLPASNHPSQSRSASSASTARLSSSSAQSSSSTAGSSEASNRRKFFGRSNSIRSLLGGSNGTSAGNSSVNADSSYHTDAIPAESTVAPLAQPHPLGLLRRMGSRSFLNLNQSKPATTNNSSSDDLASTASTDSHASHRFSDSLKNMGRRRRKSVSKDAAKSRSASSQPSSDVYSGRMVHNDVLPSQASSRRSMESGRSSISIGSHEPRQRSSEAEPSKADGQSASDSQEHYTSAPRRLTGWLYNMAGSDNAHSSLEAGAALSPVREADVLDFPDSSTTCLQRDNRDALRTVSPQKTATQLHADAGPSANTQISAPTRSKAGALFQTLANAGSSKAVRNTNASTGDHSTSGYIATSQSNIGASSTGCASSNATGGGSSSSNGSWVPSGVGFDRAFKFFMDSDGGQIDDDGIWLLGVWHGPRQHNKVELSGNAEAGVEAPAVAAGDPAASRKSEDEVGELTRAASPSSGIPASSPLRTPIDLIHTSLASSSPAFAPGREDSRVGSSISTVATTSTSDSLRTKSSATSFNVGTTSSAPTQNDPQSAFQPDFASRIWCTYRNHFAPISRDGTITDQAASAAETAAAAAASAAAHAQIAATQSAAVPSTPSGASAPDAAQTSSPPASAGRGWLGRKAIESTAAQEAAVQGSAPLGLGAALGAGYATSSLGEKMGITNFWSRATAAAQAAGFSRGGLTTDSGWGCMLRTGQSLLANALINVHLGRSWQREAPPMRQLQFLRELASLSVDANAENESLLEWREKRSRYATYIKILSWFLDDPSPACPFGVHRMAREGKRLGKEVGEWFGPSTAAGAIKQLVSEFPVAGIAVQLAHDGVFYLDEVRAAADATALVASSKARSSPGSSGRRGESVAWRRPVLILIGIRLGIDSVNPIYYESVKSTFSFPHSVGIAGGRPSSSYYFMGHQGNSLFYLDPHNVRPAVPLRYPPTNFPSAVPRQLDIVHRFSVEEKDDEDEWWSHAYSEAQMATFHCEKVRRMPIKSLDPSMLCGFLVKNEEDLQDLCGRIKGLPKTIFSFAESAPKWVDDDDFEPSMESFSEPSVGGDDSDDEGQDNDRGQAHSRANALEDTEGLFKHAPASPGEKGADAPSPSDKYPREAGDTLFKQSQQRTAAWLGRGRHSVTNSSSNGSTYTNSDGGIAFPSLDLLSPQSDANSVQRPGRSSDARQVSTSSAATTRPARRETNKNDMPSASAKGRDLTASRVKVDRASPDKSPVRRASGADESFSHVHLSDSEVGSGWEEVSDGGTIAPSGCAGGVGFGLARTGSPMRTLLSTEKSAPLTPVQADGAWVMEPSTAGSVNPVSPITTSEAEEFVGTNMDTRVNETPLTSLQARLEIKDALVAFPSGTRADGGGNSFGLTSAHEPLALPRRRSHSKPSAVVLRENSSDTAAAAAVAAPSPPVPEFPVAFRTDEQDK
ncbi:related to ATG4 - essential for autophagy [Melanopsichium pennsylvanicum]|uniref:Autophagy-related protein 4 n=2 Tax=Melanopsichium pennsylvanicum TaxID=63383 RepID=A0AAJ4XPI0_9BASI|nr:related to ATG4 - essential for autophagy [Melanopsichium pennsylvanicum]